MRVHVVDPAAYTPPYDHALCGALARAGAEVELVTSRFDYAPVTRGDGYAVRESFYGFAPGRPGGRVRRIARLAQHVPGMLAYRRHARSADIVHFQWLAVQPVDARLLPASRPLVLTAHDVLPHEPRPGQRRAQRRLYERVDAVVAHTRHGRDRLVCELGIPAERVHVIPHGAFHHLTRPAVERPLPAELAQASDDRPVVLCFGVMRPYKGIDVLLEAWRGLDGADLWVVGHPRMDVEPLRAGAPPGVRFVDRFIEDAEVPALFRRATVVVLPYRAAEQSGVLFTALAFGKPTVVTDVGGFSEVAETGAARLVPPEDPAALREALEQLLRDPAALERLSQSARAAARGPYSWDAVAQMHLDLYRALAR